MNAKISALLVATLAAVAPFASASNVALNASVTVTPSADFGVNAGWCCGAAPAPGPLQSITDGSTPLPVGQQWDVGTVFWSGAGTDTTDTITITLAQAANVTGVSLLADNNDTYSLSYLGLDNAWHSLVGIQPDTDSSWGLGDGSASFNVIATAFQIQASGDGYYAVGKFTADGTTLAAVPEPTSGLLMLAGLGAVASLARRRSAR